MSVEATTVESASLQMDNAKVSEELLVDSRLEQASPGDVFPAIILSHLGPVRSQVDCGTKWMKRQLKLVEEFERAQVHFSKAVLKAVEHERAELKSGGADKMQNLWNAQMAMYATLNSIGEVSNEYGRFVSHEVVNLINEALKDNQIRIKNVSKEAEASLKVLNEAEKKLRRAKERAMGAIRTRDAAIERDKREAESGKNRKSIWKKLSENFGGTVANLDAKVKIAKQGYEEAIEAYNEVKKKWEEEKLVKIQKDLEILERDRVEIIKKMHGKLINGLDEQIQRLQSIKTDMANAIEKVDVEVDIRIFAYSMYF